MNAQSLDELLQLARQAGRERETEAPPFFAQRVVANCMSGAREHGGNMWERFAMRGAAISFALLLLALGSSTLLSDNYDDAENDEAAAEIFTLP